MLTGYVFPPMGTAILLHSTGRTILYLQPIDKLTSQCEIRTNLRTDLRFFRLDLRYYVVKMEDSFLTSSLLQGVSTYVLLALLLDETIICIHTFLFHLHDVTVATQKPLTDVTVSDAQ